MCSRGCGIHPQLGPEWEQEVRLAENLGHFPILGGNEIEILADYSGLFERLVEDIDAATHHVHLMFYIYADDASTEPVTAALARAVR